MAKAPQARGFTLAEKRSLMFERVALWAVLLVAIIAGVISFQALTWLGTQMGLSWAAPLVPLAIDGFAIACSVGIVRSQATGEPERDRMPEWTGLFLALGLSIAGNVQHALVTKHVSVPAPLAIAFSAAVPVIVAYGIHVYGRAMARGISAHVLAGDTEHLHFDLAHLGDTSAQPARASQPKARAPKQAPARASDPAVARTKEVPAAAVARVAAVPDPLQAAARQLFEEAVKADPTTKPDAKAIHVAIGSEKNPATTRRWIAQWWAEVEETLTEVRDPILEQVGEEKGRDEVRAATA
jgi:hypothetical protein